MSKVVSFTGGKRCAECDEQINPKRLQAVPDARLCIACERDRDEQRATAMRRLDEVGRNRVSVQSRASITIKW